MSAAACAAGGDSAAPKMTTRRQPVHQPPLRQPPPQPKSRRVMVTVIDGDLSRPVRKAHVRLGPSTGITNRRGVVYLRVKRRAASVVSVRARGYAPVARRYSFRRRPFVRFRVYQPRLQWPMYGVTPTRTQVQPHISLRPPFRIAWSRGMAGLLEFPAVVDRGVAYVGNYWGSVRAVKMGDGVLIWRHDIPHGKMASSPAIFGDELIVHGMEGHVWAFDRRNGRVLWHRWIGSPIESSPVAWHGVDYFGAWNGAVYALDLRTHRLRWVYRSGAKITSSASRVGNTVYIGDSENNRVRLISGR